MSLVKLSDGCWVNADDVEEVRVPDGSNRITVRMRSGVGHCLGNDFGKDIYATMDRLVREIVAAQTKESP